MAENLQNTIEKFLNNSNYIKNMGIELVELQPGYAEGRIKINADHYNPMGTVHGGCLFSLADTIGGIAAMTSGEYVTTLSSDAHFMNAAKNTDYILAQARVVKDGRTTSVVEVGIFDQEHKECVRVLSTFFKLGKRITEETQ